MSKERTALPSLRRYLLTWFAGCALVMVFSYTQLLEYYLELGIDLRTQSFLERTAMTYAENEAPDPKLPTERNLASYHDLSDIPSDLLKKFSLDKLTHGEIQRFVNIQFEDEDDQDERRYRVDTSDLCGTQTCELLFLYPYRLNETRWLYLLHGIVGSDEAYEELEITERVAFAIGSLFAALFVIVSFLVVRNIVGPLRKLEHWSGNQNTDQVDPAVPDLRFSEFDTLAHRLRAAFGRMREGVDREKLFLRHASHELRTPIAILASNVELMDRLTDSPDRSDEEAASFVRQYRALDDVQLLMETLLWINRQSDQVPSSEEVDLRSALAPIIDNFRYLLEERNLKLIVTGDGAVISAPVAAVRIVLSNLVRNAFQYTVDGEVRIAVHSGQVTIENESSSELAEQQPSAADDEYGFGLGLELVNLICDRFNWACSDTEISGGRRTILTFRR